MLPCHPAHMDTFPRGREDHRLTSVWPLRRLRRLQLNAVFPLDVGTAAVIWGNAPQVGELFRRRFPLLRARMDSKAKERGRPRRIEPLGGGLCVLIIYSHGCPPWNSEAEDASPRTLMVNFAAASCVAESEPAPHRR